MRAPLRPGTVVSAFHHVPDLRPPSARHAEMSQSQQARAPLPPPHQDFNLDSYSGLANENKQLGSPASQGLAPSSKTISPLKEWTLVVIAVVLLLSSVPKLLMLFAIVFAGVKLFIQCSETKKARSVPSVSSPEDPEVPLLSTVQPRPRRREPRKPSVDQMYAFRPYG